MLAVMSDMWNGFAGAWEREADYVDAYMADATEVMLDAAEVHGGQAVLDLAAGPGGAGIAAARRVGASGRVVLSDGAPAMVAAAARRSGSLAQVSTLVCDQMAIDAADASFDAVICRHGLMFCEAPADAVREVVRVLRPAGRYATMTWDARSANPWLGLIFDAVGEQFGAEFPPPGVAGPFALDDPRQLSDVLADGGLENVNVQRVTTPMRAASIEEWWERVPRLAGPLGTALAAMDADARDAIHRRAAHSARAIARPAADGIELDGSVLIGSGQRPS
jgi:SAM-dependent methyltransferase